MTPDPLRQSNLSTRNEAPPQPQPASINRRLPENTSDTRSSWDILRGVSEPKPTMAALPNSLPPARPQTVELNATPRVPLPLTPRDVAQRDAFDAIHLALAEEQVFVALTGPTGAGKTAMLDATLASSPGRPLRVIRIKEADRVSAKLAARIEQAAYAEASKPANCNAHVVLAVDDAHAASGELLQCLTRLAVSRQMGRRVPQVILVGWPELWDRIAAEEYAPLVARLAIRPVLQPTAREAVRTPIERKLVQTRLDTTAEAARNTNQTKPAALVPLPTHADLLPRVTEPMAKRPRRSVALVLTVILASVGGGFYALSWFAGPVERLATTVWDHARQRIPELPVQLQDLVVIKPTQPARPPKLLAMQPRFEVIPPPPPMPTGDAGTKPNPPENAAPAPALPAAGGSVPPDTKTQEVSAPPAIAAPTVLQESVRSSTQDNVAQAAGQNPVVSAPELLAAPSATLLEPSTSLRPAGVDRLLTTPPEASPAPAVMPTLPARRSVIDRSPQPEYAAETTTSILQTQAVPIKRESSPGLASLKDPPAVSLDALPDASPDVTVAAIPPVSVTTSVPLTAKDDSKSADTTPAQEQTVSGPTHGADAPHVASAPVPLTVTATVAEMMVRRADALLQYGDVSAARLLYERAAAAGSGHAATALGKTFDPAFLAGVGIIGVSADRPRAATWYGVGVVLGDEEARTRLHALTLATGHTGTAQKEHP